MKRFFSLILVLVLAFAISSCGEDVGVGKDSDTPAVSDSGTTAVDTEALNNAPNFEIVEEITVVHETEDGRKSTKVIRYPKLSGMNDEAKQAEVNEIFRAVAERQFILNVPDVDIYVIEDTVFNYDVNKVEVTYVTPNFISVKNSVYSMTSVSEYPSCPVYTVNIDLDKAEVVEESDIIGDFNVITSKFLAGDFSMVSGAEDLFKNTNYEDMILQYKSDYASYPEIYFADGDLFICIDLVDALGTSAIFSIPVETVKDALLITP